ncbi:DNA polymerase III subunit beta [Candidatus Ichthyocystis hellenicum]|uniref:DNA polymerase III subunit beta n=1 Tax=Candidatus Ichthyocystis hellenicum TaxID=1561003 RepID=UPI000B82837E|nr:DNA polymerase III subunit beta [Candidatus Ichthyocystis hellenicum]
MHNEITLEIIVDNLLHPLQRLIGIVDRKQSIPILGNILISITASGCTILVSDGEIQMMATIETPLTEQAAVTVNARKCLDILKGIPSGTVIKIVIDACKVTLLFGKGRYSLATLPTSDFPVLFLRDKICWELCFPQVVLKKWLNLVKPASSTQDIRFFLQGVQLKVSSGSVFLVATDGHRMAYSVVATSVSCDDFSIILPQKTVTELSRTLVDKNDQVQVAIAQSQVQFSYSTTVLLSKLIEGNFPNHTRLLPSDFDISWKVDKSLILQSLHRISVFCQDKFPCVRMILSAGKITFLSLATDIEEACEELDISYEGQTHEVAYNISYITDVLSVFSDGEVCFSISSEKKSLLIFPENDTGVYGYLVMPLRV